jgi:hypothetical protein
MIRNRTLVPLVAVLAPFVLALPGCGGDVPASGETVEVSGKVPAPAGKSIAGYNLFFQPTGGKAQQVQFPITADGSFSGKMVAGTYTYYLTPGKGSATEKALEAFPEAYRKGSLDRQIDVKGGALELKF